MPSSGGGASWDPCAQTIVDARGPGTSAPYSTGNAPPAGCAPVRIPGPPSEPGSGVGLIRPRLPGAPQLRARPGAASPPAVLRRGGGEGARADGPRFLFLPRESARRTRPGRAAAPEAGPSGKWLPRPGSGPGSGGA